MQLETATNTRTLAFWCPVTFHGHPISPQSPLKHTRSLDYLASLCVLVAVYQQRKCSTYHFSDLNLCTVHRFGVHHFSKKLKLFSVVKQNLFLTTTYQITELVCLNSIFSTLDTAQTKCYVFFLFLCQILQTSILSSFTITDYVSLSGNNTRSPAMAFQRNHSNASWIKKNYSWWSRKDPHCCFTHVLGCGTAM